MTPKELKKQFAKIPHNPGIYIFKDRSGRKLYIGKAVDLKKRLFSYARVSDNRIDKMLELAKSIELHPTTSDIDALILESQLIKLHRPQFNIMLRDDKQYFYMVFTAEKFSKIFLTHQIGNWRLEIGNFIGPFTDGTALKTTLRFLRNIFPYCTCKEKHNIPCLNYHIGKCLGFCCLKQQNPNLQLTINPDPKNKDPRQSRDNRQQYQKNVRAVKDILNGKRTSLIGKLEKEMKDAADRSDFEKAIELKSKLGALKKIFENANIIHNAKFLIINSKNTGKNTALTKLKEMLDLKRLPTRIEGYDIANIQGQFASGAMVVFTNGKPDKTSYRKFNIRQSEGRSNDTAMLKEVITRRLQHNEWPLPELIVVDGGKGQVGATLAALRKQRRRIPVISLAKNARHRGNHIFIGNRKEAVSLSALPPQVRNLILVIDAEAHRFAISHYRSRHRKGIF